MRGKEFGCHFLKTEDGITPAYAGKRYQRHFRHLPHLGSPPPMRGKAKNTSPRFNCDRITPAYAGKSFRSNQPKAAVQDHPRLCGEKSRYSVTLWITAGSPPPMRGKAVHADGRSSGSGITPAYAGKSFP